MSDLEKVARAMFPFLLEAASADVERLPFAEQVKARTEIADHAARAAVEALREPSEGMVEAGWAVAPMYDDPATSPGDYWTAMIDHILDSQA